MLFGRMYPSTAAGLGAIRGLTFVAGTMVVIVSWDDPFAEPTELPEGKKLFPLRDAALYITKLPKPSTMPQSGRQLWRRSCWLSNVMGPTMFARIGMMRALNRHVERVFNSDRKDQHWTPEAVAGSMM